MNTLDWKTIVVAVLALVLGILVSNLVLVAFNSPLRVAIIPSLIISVVLSLLIVGTSVYNSSKNKLIY